MRPRFLLFILFVLSVCFCTFVLSIFLSLFLPFFLSLLLCYSISICLCLSDCLSSSETQGQLVGKTLRYFPTSDTFGWSNFHPKISLVRKCRVFPSSTPSSFSWTWPCLLKKIAADKGRKQMFLRYCENISFLPPWQAFGLTARAALPAVFPLKGMRRLWSFLSGCLADRPTARTTH